MIKRIAGIRNHNLINLLSVSNPGFGQAVALHFLFTPSMLLFNSHVCLSIGQQKHFAVSHIGSELQKKCVIEAHFRLG